VPRRSSIRHWKLALGLATLGTLLLTSPTLASDEAPDPKDRVVISGGTKVQPDEVVGDVFVVSGDVLIIGRVEGDVVVLDGDVQVGDVATPGTVQGDLTTIAGKATLAPAARVTGDLIYSDERPSVARPASVGGEIREEDWGEIGDAPWALIGAAALWIAVSLSLLVAGTALVVVFPRAAEAAREAAQSQIWLTVAMGLAAIIGLPLMMALAFVTLVGIPLAIMVGLAFLPLASIGYLVCCFILGRVVTNEETHPILAFLAGLGILRAIALIPIAGGLAWIPAVVVGLGALIVAAMPNGETAPAA